MSWIKRNLFFVIGGVLAVILLGLAGYYLYVQWGLNNEKTAKLEQDYADLERISNLQPNPGNDKVDNISIAKANQRIVRAQIAQTAGFFVPVPPIPPETNVSAADFSGALRKTIDELTHNAATASVTLQPKYDFSFAAQRPLVKFSPGSLGPLAGELGDVKAICDVLFKAKVNMLYNLRRPRVSDDDLKGPQSDYLDVSPTTNDLAVLMPYEVTFYGFSGELAAVLSDFAADSHGFIITTLNVEPGMPSSNAAMDANGAMMPEGAPMMNRYTYPGTVAPAVPATMAAGRGGLLVALDEKQLKITIGVIVVKLLPKK